MHRIYLLNQKQFIHNIQLGCNISSSLFFDVKYHDVALALTETNLILDLQNIIMTYVNDNFEVWYEIMYQKDPVFLRGKPTQYISFRINCNIWFTNIVFNFRYEEEPISPQRYYSSVSPNNNVLTSTMNLRESMNMELYEHNFDLFFTHFGRYFPKEYHYLSFKKMTNRKYGVADDCKKLHSNVFINILSMRKFRKVISIMKLIDSAILCAKPNCINKEKIDI